MWKSYIGTVELGGTTKHLGVPLLLFIREFMAGAVKQFPDSTTRVKMSHATCYN